ncbi:MAG: MerR family transcriptional regulator [Clostridia bacterium]|nr:MerR family transcriptional regulator [Clostridia bacterium]
MDERPEIRQYRIGDYARHMGVTADLLKHYEQYGLLSPVVTASGYRYYPFTQSPQLLKCMELRSYGVPLRGMDAMLHEDDLTAYVGHLDERAEAIRRRMQIDAALLREHEALHGWLARMEGRSEDVRVRESAPMLFLPHSTQYSFIDDPDVCSLLPQWIPMMPMVKSCLSYPDPLNGQDFHWGLCIREAYADTLGLPLSGAVRRIPQGQLMTFSFKGYQPESGQNLCDALRRRCLDVAAGRGLQPAGEMHLIIIMQTQEADGPAYHGLIRMPVRPV